ncbi:hypothetical protein EVAR_69180_1 [Eumeta japonica]|uniref:Uncharacterized protein n=1 Tax=Eumeta variegata TaxID=151549 RepID=A0A4C1ZCK0_EUMVA|nr:hypothetical protein EVAR_69180_1 [Eumeta japonica]
MLCRVPERKNLTIFVSGYYRIRAVADSGAGVEGRIQRRGAAIGTDSEIDQYEKLFYVHCHGRSTYKRLPYNWRTTTAPPPSRARSGGADRDRARFVRVQSYLKNWPIHTVSISKYVNAKHSRAIDLCVKRNVSLSNLLLEGRRVKRIYKRISKADCCIVNVGPVSVWLGALPLRISRYRVLLPARTSSVSYAGRALAGRRLGTSSRNRKVPRQILDTGE